jgi:cytochrome c oxidase assembly protein subunit 15
MSRLTKLAWTAVVFNVGVIVFGSVVRATKSGAGCGPHWPACNGQFIPSAIHGARLIEFTHRITSGIALALVAVLVWRVYRSLPRGHRARKAVTWAGVFVMVEAGLGAMLVLFEWVAYDVSVARTVAVPIHLVSTLALLASLTLTAHWVGGSPPPRWQRRGWLLIAGGVGVALVAASGGVTALADTLFPSDSISSSLATSFDSAEHFLARLRVAHPLVAVVVGLSLIWIVRSLGQDRRSGRVVVGLVIAQFAAGVLNVVLLTPLWLQLTHLVLADTLWVTYVLFGADVLSSERTITEAAALRAGL